LFDAKASTRCIDGGDLNVTFVKKDHGGFAAVEGSVNYWTLAMRVCD